MELYEQLNKEIDSFKKLCKKYSKQNSKVNTLLKDNVQQLIDFLNENDLFSMFEHKYENLKDNGDASIRFIMENFDEWYVEFDSNNGFHVKAIYNDLNDGVWGTHKTVVSTVIPFDVFDLDKLKNDLEKYRKTIDYSDIMAWDIINKNFGLSQKIHKSKERDKHLNDIGIM